MPKNLLLADDSITIQKVVGITFAGEDFKITAVDNGEDAIARARELRPDVILADVVMPRRNGYEVCEAIKTDPALQHIPVLLLAGTFESFDESRARAVRADGHIAKPFESQALINKVKELLGGALPKAEAAHEMQAVADSRQAVVPVPGASAAAPAPRPASVPAASAPRAPAPPQPGGSASVRPPVGAPPPGRAPMPGILPVAAMPRAAIPPGVRSPPPGIPPGVRPPVRPPPGLRPPVPVPVPPAPGAARSPVAPLFGSRSASPEQPSGVPGARPPFGGPAAYPRSAALPSVPVPAPPTAAPSASPAGAEARPAKPPSAAPRPSSPGFGAPAQKPAPPSAVAASPQSPGEDDWSDLDVSDAAAGPTRGVDSAAPGVRAASTPVALPSAPSSPVAAAEVVALDDLDFGEPSPFAAPPRPAVEHAPEQPEAIDLPMLEAEEEIELVPKAEETGHQPEAKATPVAAPPLEPGASSSLTLTPDRAPAPPLAFASEADLDVATPPASLPTPIPSSRPRVALAPPGEGAALQAATPMAATPGTPPAAAAPDGGEAQLRDALSHASREVIERIAWEVVPQLAETIIREQLDRLVKDRQR